MLELDGCMPLCGRLELDVVDLLKFPWDLAVWCVVTQGETYCGLTPDFGNKLSALRCVHMYAGVGVCESKIAHLYLAV
jgi:hypothetical protein